MTEEGQPEEDSNYKLVIVQTSRITAWMGWLVQIREDRLQLARAQPLWQNVVENRGGEALAATGPSEVDIRAQQLLLPKPRMKMTWVNRGSLYYVTDYAKERFDQLQTWKPKW